MLPWRKAIIASTWSGPSDTLDPKGFPFGWTRWPMPTRKQCVCTPTTCRLTKTLLTDMREHDSRSVLLCSRISVSKVFDLSLDEDLAHGYAGAQEYGAAIVVYNEALRRQPERSSLWVGLAEAHAHLSQADQALRSLVRAESLRPADALLLCRIGIAYKDLGKRKQARKAIQEAVRLDPKNATCSTWLQELR